MTFLHSYPNPLLRTWRLGEDIQRASVQYRAMRRFLQMMMFPLCKMRIFGRHYEPADGGAVYVCNHQSFLDPALMALALRRPVNYMARDTLFHVPVFGRIIGSLNAFPIRRASADLSALKEAMRRLKAGSQVGVFAEGRRTSDGRIGPFLPGVAILARRAAKWTIPVLIDGAFEAWPRQQALPRPGSIVVRYAPPIPQHEVRKLEPAVLLECLRKVLIEMQTEVRATLGRPSKNYE